MHIYTTTSISFQANNTFNTVADDHPKFQAIVDLCLAGQYDEAVVLVDVKSVVEELITGSEVTLVGSSLYYNGKPVSGLLGQRIIQMANMGLPVDSLVAFLKNLMLNPSNRAVNELYGFLEASKLPITEDGHFLAYKSVTQDFLDHHSRSMDNSVGSVVSMPRNGVDEDKDRTCSNGLHFAAHNYAKSFGSSGRMVVLKINPRDVVAIPSDYNNEKGRCCEYTVLEEVKREDTKLVNAGVVVTKPVYVPQVDNYGDEDLWGGWTDMFFGEASEFPVNRKSTYHLSRHSNSKSYVDFFFVNYDEVHDNLVFRRHNGIDWDYCTIADLNDWDIEWTEKVSSDEE